MEKDLNGIDKQNIDFNKIESYSSVSTDIKKIVSKEQGVKYSTSEETVIMSSVIDDDTGEIRVEIKRGREYKKIFKEFIQDHGKSFMLGMIYALMIGLNVIGLIKFYISYRTMDISFTDFGNPIYEIILMISPSIIWLFMTNYTVFNFRKRKLLLYYIAHFFFNFAFIRLAYVISYKAFIPFIARIEPTAEMTADKIVSLGYLAITLPIIAVFSLLLVIAIRATALNKEFMARIEQFRLFKVYDLEHFSKFEYTFKIVRDIETGKYITIPQKDRQTHTSIIGATGTAKTSSVFLPGIYNDIVVRASNLAAMKKAFIKYTKLGLFRMKKPFDDIDFEPDFFEVNPDYKVTIIDRLIGRTPERMLEEVLNKYELAGQTILAPEDSLPDDAYDLITKHGFKCNRVDPKLDDKGQLKPGFKGMNILYISPSLPEWNVDREKVRRATLLSDVMQIMFEMGGKSDPYFASVNRIATTTVALLLQLTFPTLKGRQPNLLDVRDGLNNFESLREHYDHLFPNGQLTKENKRWRWLKDNLINFFLGPGAETFEQHARGLKVQFTSFLADNYISTLVSAEEVIDFDEMLSKNQFTVVNIELPEIGPINSPALGLFFTINMNDAVLRRPGTENTRSFHVWRIDEFPIVVTPSMEQAFTLYRKFKVAMEVALQTLDQMQKTPYLKYLAGVIMNSTANQIFFGRASLSEMELVSKLSGTEEDYIDMEGTSETSIFSENPSLSTTKRKTKTIANNVELSDVRFKDFQEVQYSFTKRGSLMRPVHGKVEFLKRKHKRGPRIIKRYNWLKLYNKTSLDRADDKPVVKEDNKATLALSKEQLEQVRRTEEKAAHEIKFVEPIKNNHIEDVVHKVIFNDKNQTPEVEQTDNPDNTTESIHEVKHIVEDLDFIDDASKTFTDKSKDELDFADSSSSEKIIKVKKINVDEVNVDEELDFIDSNVKIDPHEKRVYELTKKAQPVDSKEARRSKMEERYNSYLD